MIFAKMVSETYLGGRLKRLWEELCLLLPDFVFQLGVKMEVYQGLLSNLRFRDASVVMIMQYQ